MLINATLQGIFFTVALSSDDGICVRSTSHLHRTQELYFGSALSCYVPVAREEFDDKSFYSSEASRE